MKVRRWRCSVCESVLEAAVDDLDAVFRAHAERCAGEPVALRGMPRRTTPASLHIADLVDRTKKRAKGGR